MSGRAEGLRRVQCVDCGRVSERMSYASAINKWFKCKACGCNNHRVII